MAEWSDIIARQAGGALSKRDRQAHRAIAQDYEFKKRMRGVLRSYGGWLLTVIPVAIAVASYFLHNGGK